MLCPRYPGPGDAELVCDRKIRRVSTTYVAQGVRDACTALAGADCGDVAGTGWVSEMGASGGCVWAECAYLLVDIMFCSFLLSSSLMEPTFLPSLVSVFPYAIAVLLTVFLIQSLLHVLVNRSCTPSLRVSSLRHHDFHVPRSSSLPLLPLAYTSMQHRFLALLHLHVYTSLHISHSIPYRPRFFHDPLFPPWRHSLSIASLTSIPTYNSSFSFTFCW